MTTAESPVIRVATWNLWGRNGGHERRLPAIVETLRRIDADVIMLQESWAQQGDFCQAEYLAAQLGGHSSAWAHGPWFSGFWLGNSVLSRWPMVRTEVHRLPRLDNGDPMYRHITLAHVQTPWGEWPFASTHFEHPFDGSRHRMLHAETLMHVVRSVRAASTNKLPVVVGGDLNAVPDSDEIRMLTGRKPGVPGVVFSDVWEHVGAGGRFGSEGLTWRSDNPNTGDSSWPNRRLDYILVSHPRKKPAGNARAIWLAGTEAIDGVYPSDHAAVVAELAVPRTDPDASAPDDA